MFKKYKFSKQRLIYTLIFIFLTVNFLLLAGLMHVGIEIADAQRKLAET